MRLAALISAFAALVLCSAAAAADPALAPFEGQWVGKATVETVGPTDFPTSVRDVGVTLTDDGKGGFKLEWSTVKRETGDPNRPDEIAADTVVVFAPAGENRWAAAGGDPAKGQALWFARLDGSTLTVSGFALAEDGKTELQTYVRTIEDATMSLVYTRVSEGVVTRRASGALTRFAP